MKTIIDQVEILQCHIWIIKCVVIHLLIYKTLQMKCNCCILTLDWAINQRFSAQDTTVKISGRTHVVEQKCVGVTKWYMQMSTWDTDSLSLAARRGLFSHRKRQWVVGFPTADLQLSTPCLRSRRSAIWGLEDNVQHGMVKRSTYGSIWLSVFVYHCLPFSVSRIYRFDPLSREIKMYIFLCNKK